MTTRKKITNSQKEKITRVRLMEDGRLMKIQADGSLKPAPKGKTDWKALHTMKDGDINYSDSPEFTDAEWAKVKLVMPRPKDRLTIRLDHDVLGWLKKKGSGYQTRINAILRQYMDKHT